MTRKFRNAGMCVRLPSTIVLGASWKYCQQPRLWSEFESPSYLRTALIRARRRKLERGNGR